MTDLEHDIDVIRRWAIRNPVIQRVHIFGSRVRGTERADSDLDVAVEHGVMLGDGDHTTTGLFGHSEWQSELQPLCRCQLQVESYRPGETPTVEAGIKESSRLILDRATQMDNARRMYDEALARIHDAHILANPVLNAQSDASAHLGILGFEILLKTAVFLAGCPRDRLDYSHRYFDIWNKLPTADRAEILKTARARMPHHADLSDIRRVLNAWQYVFEQGRYYYELYENWTLDQQHEFGEYWLEIGGPIEEADIKYYPQELTCMIDALKAYLEPRLRSRPAQ